MGKKILLVALLMGITCGVKADERTLVDTLATEATVNLYNYLKANYGQNTLTSAMANVNWNYDQAKEIYKAVGKYPAMNCFDFIHICVPKPNYWIDYDNITPVRQWHQAGGIVALMWHFNVPKDENSKPGTDGSGVDSRPWETTFVAANALVDGTWENKWFYTEMKKVADVMLKLQKAGIPALWRPFHEAAGNYYAKNWKGDAWFWWGTGGPVVYKNLWKAMWDYFQERGIHNLIWVWTAQNFNGNSNDFSNDAPYYPGNDYVDIVGRDLYGMTTSQCNTEYQQLKRRYSKKLVAMAECGYDTAPISEEWDKGARWLYFMPWYGEVDKAWWQKALDNEHILWREDVDIDAFTGIRPTSQTTNPVPDGLYNLHGQPVSSNASLPRGVYVLSYEGNCKKILIQ